MKNKLVSIILVSYNSMEDLAECIPSILSQTYTNYEIIIVDNASIDKTIEFIKTNYPNIKLVESKSNLGYAHGNNVGFKCAKGEYVVVLNPDTVTDPEWLYHLIRPLEECNDISLTTSKIMMYDHRDIINTCANHPHFTGLDFCRGLYEKGSHFSKPEEVGSISGCSFAIRRDIFEELDGFDSDFFLYLEDVDLSWRARLLGYKIMYIPTSILYHKFRLSVAPWKQYYLERNRYTMLIKNYNMKIIILIIPALLMTELMTWVYALSHGFSHVHEKLRSYSWVITNLNKIVAKRHNIQRKIGDKEFIRLLEWKIPEQVIESKAIYIINSYYKICYKMMNKII